MLTERIFGGGYSYEHKQSKFEIIDRSSKDESTCLKVHIDGSATIAKKDLLPFSKEIADVFDKFSTTRKEIERRG